MSANGLLINYEYCTGCHSCEVACKKEHGLPLDQWGIKLLEIGPIQLDEKKWEWDFIPTPTDLCDLCEERVSAGEKPTCVHHCLANCMVYGTVEELSKIAAEADTKTVLFYK